MGYERDSKEFADPQDKLVLVVDDDTSILELLEHAIKKKGFRVAVAEDGQKALEKAQALSPDLIILDFMLPGIGGFEIIRRLQAEAPAIPIIGISGRRIDASSLELLKQEPNIKEFLEKPIRVMTLTSTIYRILKAHGKDSGLLG